MKTRGVDKEQLRKERDWLISLSTLLFSTTFVKDYAKIEHSSSTVRRVKNEKLSVLAERPLMTARLIHRLYSSVMRKIIRMHEKMSVIVNEPIHKISSIYKKYDYAKSNHRVSEARRLKSTIKEVLGGLKINKQLTAKETDSKLKRGKRW